MNRGDLKKTIGICSVGFMGMGVVGISSVLPVIGAHFPHASQTMIQNMITIPCIVIILVTLIAGGLMRRWSKKKVTIAGIIFYLIGGIGPYFAVDLTSMFILRAVLGVGIGIAQVAMTALVVENFNGAERTKVQGLVQASQMAAMGTMSIFSGILASIRWNLCFGVYSMAFISLICVVLFVPDIPPDMKRKTDAATSGQSIRGCAAWVALMFAVFIAMMIYSAYFSYLLAEKGLGSPVDTGISLALYAAAGAIAGTFYGRVENALKNKVIAAALILRGITYVMFAGVASMVTVHVASILTGVALSLFMPQIFLNAGASVPAGSAPMAIAAATCAQNLGQFVCPYIFNPMAARLCGSEAFLNRTVFIAGAICLLALGLVMLVWGWRKDKKIAEVCL